MKALIGNYVLLILIGLALVYSSTYKRLIGGGSPPWFYLAEQILIISLLFVFFLIVLSQYKFFYKLINKYIIVIHHGLLVCLVLVRTSLGTVVGGAKSSLSIAGFNFQPIEFYKIALILYLAKILVHDSNKLTDKDFIIKRLKWPLLGIAVTAIEPDIGGAAIMFALLLVILFLSGQKSRLLGKILLGSIVVGIFFILFANQIGMDRITSWLTPFQHMDSDGQNLVQSFIAISNGGISGVGYLNSIQNTGFLYASSTDFIFSIIAEEFGIIGVLIIITLLFTLSYQIYRIGLKSTKKSEFLACAGIAFLVLIQTAVNIGGVTGLIPMTGVTLPFISRGVNSYVAMNLAILYVMLVYLNIKEEKSEKKHPKSARQRKKQRKESN